MKKKNKQDTLFHLNTHPFVQSTFVLPWHWLHFCFLQSFRFQVNNDFLSLSPFVFVIIKWRTISSHIGYKVDDDIAKKKQTNQSSNHIC